MRILLILCMIILTAMQSQRAYADYFDGNELRALASSNLPQDVGMFRGYVAGIQDFNNGEYFCVHQDVRLSQSSAIVEKYLEENPQDWHLSAKQNVIAALVKSFPCGK